MSAQTLAEPDFRITDAKQVAGVGYDAAGPVATDSGLP
jgi:hypothetical protein